MDFWWLLLGQVPSTVWLVVAMLAFILVVLVLCHEPACDRLVRVLKALRKR